jgi:IS605 OrfB family transposase
MGIITIQCRLQAEEETLRYLWTLMVEKNTLLLNQTLETIRTAPELGQWLSQGSIRATTMREIVKNLKQQPKFQGMPGRFADSAERLVKQIYKSWFAGQRNKRRSLFGKKRWLAMLRSEQELLEETGLTLQQLQTEAQKILTSEQKKLDKLKQKEVSATKIPRDLHSHLFELYDRVTKDYEKEKLPQIKHKKLIERCAIVYLFKNQGKIGTRPENNQTYQEYRRKKEIEIERLEEQLKGRLPKGRNLDFAQYLEALEQAEGFITENEEMELIQARLLRSDKPIPFSVSYDTNTDIYWSKNEQGRICVTFNGMTKNGLIFEVYCGNRQLHWFERFYEDYQLYKQNKEQVPGGLLTIRSARLVWQQDEGDDRKPWLTNNLSLHCSLETQLWTKEGTEEVRKLKIAETEVKIQQWEKKAPLNQNQQKMWQRDLISLERLKSFQGFSRPSKSSPRQNPSLIMGVSIGLQQPATIAVVDVITGKVLVSQDTKQLLSKPVKQKPKKGKKVKKHTQYELLLLRRKQQQENDARRQQAQIKDGNNSFGESELGKYVDRLLAKAIIEIALQYRVSSILLPDLTNIREILNSEITFLAEAKIPGCKQAQKLYAKKYRQNIHRWSYARLCDAIKSQAAKKGIAIECDRQLPKGTPEIQARDLALAAYHHRQEKIS